MEIRWIVFVLAIFLLVTPTLNDRKMVQNANAQSTGEVITSIATEILSGCWSILGYCNAGLSAVLNAFTACYASMMVTAPEFTTGLITGMLFFFIVGYAALAIINPIGWLSILGLLILGLPILLPLEMLSGIVCALVPGSMLGLLLGTLNLLTQRPTPLDVVVSGIS